MLIRDSKRFESIRLTNRFLSFRFVALFYCLLSV